MNLSQEQFNRMVNDWNFSELHLRLNWEDLTEISDDIKFVMAEYVKNFTANKDEIFNRMRSGQPQGLYLFSEQTGTAKTSLVQLIAKELVLQGKSIKRMLYLHSIELKTELKRTFSENGNEAEVLDKITKADVLVIDDFDKLLGQSNYDKERASLIFDTRYRQLRPTIFTANKSPEQLLSGGQLETHLYSRLVEMCQIFPIEVKQDFRTKGRLTIQPKKERNYL